MSHEARTYPEILHIEPLRDPPRATIQVPGSKSITNRALILAALSDPSLGSTLTGVLRSEDTEVITDALSSLGFRMQEEPLDASDGPRLPAIHVRRGNHARPIPASGAELFLGNSGTSMRFLTALVSLGQGSYRLDGVARMRERPIGDLLAALQQLGVNAYSANDDGYPPVIVEANGLRGGRARLKGNVSSQFLSGLLMAAPLAKQEVTIEIDGPLVSEPYVAMTIEMMRQFGISADGGATTQFHIPLSPHYTAQTFAVEPDASAASYFFAAAAITGGEVTVPGLGASSLQGDISFAHILQEMGASVTMREHGTHLSGRWLRGLEVDMNKISDCAMTLAAVACFADGPTTIRNVAHIRYKETDRLTALATELRRVGAQVEEFSDGLRITPRPLHGAVIETYNDHRMAMSMAIVGLKVPGIAVRNPGCVAKTYPTFFDDLAKLRR
jgi:3-phosphoshikimate 1-carboxyvinyltransferase